jgi:hypothetical protein
MFGFPLRLGVFARAMFLLVAIAAPVLPETIDRVAVSVGNRVITTSDIERQIRVAAFLSGTKPDLSPKSRREAADRLIDQKLIQLELETARYPEPAPQELEAVFDEFKAKFYPLPDDYRRALAASGITEDDIKEQLHWQRRWVSFVGLRFRPGTGVTEREISDYFDSTVAPAARAANPSGTVTLDEFRERIADKLVGDRVDAQMAEWLGKAREQTEVVFHEEAFK